MNRRDRHKICISDWLWFSPSWHTTLSLHFLIWVELHTSSSALMPWGCSIYSWGPFKPLGKAEPSWKLLCNRKIPVNAGRQITWKVLEYCSRSMVSFSLSSSLCVCFFSPLWPEWNKRKRAGIFSNKQDSKRWIYVRRVDGWLAEQYEGCDTFTWETFCS